MFFQNIIIIAINFFPLEKIKIIDVEDIEEDWENIDTTENDTSEKVIYYNDYSNEYPLSNKSYGDF